MTENDHWAVVKKHVVVGNQYSYVVKHPEASNHALERLQDCFGTSMELNNLTAMLCKLVQENSLFQRNETSDQKNT